MGRWGDGGDGEDGEDGEDGGDVQRPDFSRSLPRSTSRLQSFPPPFVVTTSVVSALLGIKPSNAPVEAKHPVPIQAQSA